DHEAEGAALQVGGTPCGFENAVPREKRVLLDLGRRDLRLRTVVAVLRAEPALGVQQEVESHPVAPVVAADLPCGGELIQDRLVRGGKNGPCILPGNRLSGEG